MINLLKVITTMGIDEICRWNIKIWLVGRALPATTKAALSDSRYNKARLSRGFVIKIVPVAWTATPLEQYGFWIRRVY